MDFSVIIPVYNSEKTISQTVESIEEVRLDNMEIILVDDGSTDCTQEICKTITNNYHNVRYYYQPNVGVSAARNNGIAHAKGDYILFWDSDDIADSVLLQKCMQKAVEQNTDMLIFGMKQKRLYKGKVLYVDSFKCEKEERLPQFSLAERISDLFDINYLTSGCNKILKRSICQKVCFNTTKKVFEDLLYVLEYMNYCDSVYLMPDLAYLYYVELSADRASRYKSIEDFEQYMKEFQNAVFGLESYLGTELLDLRIRIAKVYEWILQDRLFFCSYKELKKTDPSKLQVTMFGEPYVPPNKICQLYFRNKLLSLRLFCLYQGLLNTIKLSLKSIKSLQ